MIPRQPDRCLVLCFCAAAGGLMLLGVAYYLAVRTDLPPLLEFVRPGPPQFRSAGAPQWLPNLIHVAAFTLLTAALLRPGIPSAIACGALWAGIDTLWEFACRDHQAWLDAGMQLIGGRRVPACTYDLADIAASLAGGVLAVGVAGLVTVLHPNPTEETS